MRKKYFTRLLQASLMCCLAVFFTACDDFFGSESNPTPAYLSMSDKPVTIKVGETFQRQAIAAGTAVIEYTSSDTKIATVDNTGLVTAIAEGETTITATATGYSSQTGKKIYLPDSKSYKVTVEVGGGSVVPLGPTPDPKATPLTMEAITAGTIKVTSPKSGMQYTLNGGTKTAVTTTAIDVAVGDKVAFYGKGTSISCYGSTDPSNCTKIAGGTAEVKVYGNIMSLLDETGFATATTLPATEYTFYELFSGNDKLKDANGLLLPAETLTEYCYSRMFSGCTALTAAPALPAEKLTANCYSLMFSGCTALTAAPELPAETLEAYCYANMFEDCTSLTTAPELKAAKVPACCYQSMFKGCTSLTTAPKLSATEVGYSSCWSMFEGCTKLTAAPELKATTLARSCYQSMFNGCTSLTTAPALPATDLAISCYESMFYGCTSLATAPAKLPAMELKERCYYYMFRDCASLNTAPALPATTLAKECYYYMFSGCTCLTSAPKLPATDLANRCYYAMFFYCTALTNAYVKAAYTTANQECYNMFKGCEAASATLHTTNDHKASWEGVMGSGKDWSNWTVDNNWTE